MKTTNAVIDYITRTVAKKIPQPISTSEYEALKDEAKEIEHEYFVKMQEYSDTLVKEVKEKHPNMSDALVHTNGIPSISVNLYSTSISKQSAEDSKLRAAYMSDIVARIVAGVSTIKDMDALDIFIANTIERMSR
jgi:hypothetical protein